MAKTTDTIGSLTEILKSASELVKSGKGGLASALATAGAGWLGPAFAAAAGAAGLARAIAKMLDERAKSRPADEVGKEALTAAFVAAAATALRLQGRPDSRAPFDDAAMSGSDLKGTALLDYYGTLAGFDSQRPTSHAWYRFAARSLDDILSAQAYSERERRLVANKTDEVFIEVWQGLKADPEARETLERFEKWAKETLPSYLDTILVHIEHQRWTFRDKPLLGKEHFSLADVYLQTDCVMVTGDAVRFRNHRPSPKRRAGLLETVDRLIGSPEFVDMILIEAPPGYGKSAFTLFLNDYLYGRGLLPLRIRVRDLASIEKQQIWEALESRIAWRPPEEPPNSIFRGFTRNPNPFQNGVIFNSTRNYGQAEICPYVLILDGWDEVAAGTGIEYRERLRTLLLEIRRIFVERQDARTAGAGQIRVILTGRPGDNLFPDEVLTRGVRILDLQPFTQEQLNGFFGKLMAAVERPRLKATPSPIDWPLHTRWHQMEYVVQLYDPERRDSVLGYPLLAHLSFWIYAKRLETDPASDARSLLSDTTSLYRQLVDLTCAEAGKAAFEEWNTASRERHKAAGPYLRDLIRRTAAAAYCAGESGAISREQLLRFLPREHRLRGSVAGMDPNPLSELLVSYYFTSEHPERGCEFVHQSFLEYLYAEALVEWLKALPDSTVPEAVTQADVDAPRSNDTLLWLLRCFCTVPLSDQVLKHLLRLTTWEITRARNGEVEQDGQTAAASIASWQASLARLSEVLGAIEEERFFVPAGDRSPALYHYLSCTGGAPRSLTKVDELAAAGFINTAGIVAHALLPDGERLSLPGRYDGLGRDGILQRAARTGGRIFLRSADLRGPLGRLRLLKADLRGATFSGNMLNQTNLWGDFIGADLTGITGDRAMIGGNLSAAKFCRASLRHVRLHEAHLMDADFSGADLEGADLSAASIQGADFRTAKHLSQKQIDQAFGDDGTKLPKRLRRPAGWPHDRPTPDDWEADE